MEGDDEKIKCPRCGSTQIIANKKGFSAGKAIGGALLTGGIGILAGAIGSGKIKITCLKCGNIFKPGDKTIEENKKHQPILIGDEKGNIEENIFENISGLGCFLIIIGIASIAYFLFK